ncbi:MAG TPA: urea transporter [Polyangia bacterium]|nr:urea transporter [Polyangia bacterium]
MARLGSALRAADWAAAAWRAAAAAGEAVLRSYAQILISRSRAAGFLLLVATALDVPTMVGGLAALAGAALAARALSLSEGAFSEGPTGYNALFVGLAVGHLFGAGAGGLGVAAAWGALSAVVTAFVAATAGRALALPALTMPFVLSTYLLLLVAPSLGLPPRSIPTPASLLAPGLGAAHSTTAGWLAWIGALVFVPRPEAGLLVVAALLVHSRVACLLAATGAVALAPLLRPAAPLPDLPPTLAAPLLFNGVLAAMALGGTWFVPGPASFALGAAAAAVSAIAAIGLRRPLAAWGLPLLVLPFNVVVLVLLCAMRQRTRDRRPKAVDFAPGSPEQNLRFHQTRTLRAAHHPHGGLAFALPFRGAWLCTQGVNGSLTHQGAWRHAFDFEVSGADGRLHDAGTPADCVDAYHCYGLPVLAAADGTVVAIENDVPDNPIGGVDLERNWGNVVVLVHAPSVYSVVAHLAPRSVAVREGQIVARGDVLGLCGSSGRSPRPHLHFQLQASPVLGAPTIPCAFENAVATAPPGSTVPRLATGVVPREGEIWRNPDGDVELAKAFAFAPGTSCVYRVTRDGGAGETERVRCEVDRFGQTVLRSEAGGVLSFARTANQFTVFDVQAPPRSVLHLLRAALGRVPLIADPGICWDDHLPPAWRAPRWYAALREVVAPFLPDRGRAMEYRCLRERGGFAIVGRASSRRAGVAAVRSRALLDVGHGSAGWPISVEVTVGGGATVRATRVEPSASAPVRPGARPGGPRPLGPGASAPTLSRIIQLPRPSGPAESLPRDR